MISFLFLVLAMASVAADKSPQPQSVVTANNPDPQRLPSLGVWEDGQSGGFGKLLMVSAQFPNVPDFTCDSWCYESEVDFVGARATDGGRLELRHRVREQPQVLLVTTLTTLVVPAAAPSLFQIWAEGGVSSSAVK